MVASVSSWPLSFTITSADTSEEGLDRFWATIEVGDARFLPINICGGWNITARFNQGVNIVSVSITFISSLVKT